MKPRGIGQRGGKRIRPESRDKLRGQRRSVQRSGRRCSNKHQKRYRIDIMSVIQPLYNCVTVKNMDSYMDEAYTALLGSDLFSGSDIAFIG